ncbi:MAG: S-methyl-5-thioribose-1-phosphate isomerase, partial [Acidimicrobiia bacterium]|nr:S-methyl-5-thioribose-1-phosphate isomerase [Acidimicrobiia bacterium]
MQTISWNDDAIDLIDQTKLPHELTVFRATTVAQLVDAIKRLVVRGAPAIGVAGGYGVVLAMGEADPTTDPEAFARLVDEVRNARPTAVNLAVRVDEVLTA